MPAPPPPAASSSGKISCLACRAAKVRADAADAYLGEPAGTDTARTWRPTQRKCNSEGTHTRCARCVKQKLLCEYREHHRGRRLSSRDSASPDRSHDDSRLRRSSALHVSFDTDGAGSADNTIARPESSVVEGGEDQDGGPSEIRFSHLVPETGDSWPYIRKDSATSPRHGLAPLQAVQLDDNREHVMLQRLLEIKCLDPVQAGVLTRRDAAELFDLYFSSLNLLVPILDPDLCTPDGCQKECPLLFTAVLTITSKVLCPKAYRSCLLLANRLLGQAIEEGQCSVEIVQAIHLLVHFKEPEDNTGWRRIGYAIRMALELRLNIFRPSPVESSKDARRRLNGERTWINLLISDYHHAIHHSLPRMITDDCIDDVDTWVANHATMQVRGESFLPVLVTFSRLCRLYADLLESMSGDGSNLRLLSWVERRWKQWRERYITQRPQGWEQLQQATLLLCDSFFAFHVAEYKLLFQVRYRKDLSAQTHEATKVSFAFNECIEAAMGPSLVFVEEYVSHELLPYASNILWVASAVTIVWLVRNSRFMNSTYREQVINMLDVVQRGCEAASRTPADLPAYMSRLIRHLLSTREGGGHDLRDTPMNGVGPDEEGMTPRTHARPDEETSRQLIQDTLWSRRPSTVPTSPHVPSDAIQSHTAWPLPAHPLATATTQQASHDESSMIFPSADDEFW